MEKKKEIPSHLRIKRDISEREHHKLERQSPAVLEESASGKL
jgi:hypothetical protein